VPVGPLRAEANRARCRAREETPAKDMMNSVQPLEN
jgi:hypothetical protein